MTRPRQSGKRRGEAPSDLQGSGSEAAAPVMRMRAEGERRTKAREDLGASSRGNEIRQPLTKRARVVSVPSESEEEEELDAGTEQELEVYGGLAEHSVGMAEHEQSWSQGYNTDDSNCDTDEAIEAMHPTEQRRGVPSSTMKKPIELDVQGQPHGSMRDTLEKDVKKYAKSLDPTTGWEGQPKEMRRGFFKRLYTDWQMVGDSDRVSEKWLQPFITKVLINTRWRIGQMIASGMDRPKDIKKFYWDTIEAARGTEAAQKKSAQMRSISRGKASTTTQLKVIEREVVARLTMLNNRRPFDTEIDAEVAKEFARIEEEKRRLKPNIGQELEDMRARVSNLEGSMVELKGSVVKIGNDMTTSHKRVEEMFKELMQNVSSSSADAFQLASKNFLQPMLQPVAIPEVVAPVILDVHKDVPEDVGGNVTIGEDGISSDHEAVLPEESGEGLNLQEESIAQEEVEGEKEAEDAYALVATDAPEEATGVAEVDAAKSPRQQNDEDVPTESTGRPRRAVKPNPVQRAGKAVANAGKASASTPLPKPSTPKAIGLPKPNPSTSKGATTRKADAPRKK